MNVIENKGSRPLKDTDSLLKDFEAYLLLERSFSANTASAYCVDTRHMIDYINGQGIPLTQISEDTLHNLLSTLHDIGLSPRSQARMITGMRAFFRFLIMEDYVINDPSRLIDLPRLSRELPDVLTIQEIDAMIAAIPPKRMRVCETMP